MLTGLGPRNPYTRYLLLADDGDGDGGGAGGGGGDTKTFTQAEVDRMVGKARGEAKRSAASELAETLGCTVDEAKAKIAAAAEADKGRQTEAEQALAAATAARAEADAEKAAARAERFAAKVERKLIAAGIDDKTLARASRLIDLDADASDDEIAAEIDALKEEVPALFAASEGDAGEKAPAPKPGLKGAKPPAAKGLGGKSMEDFGREQAKRLGIKIAS